LLNSEAAHFQEARQRGRRARNQPSMNRFDVDAVVGDQTRKDRMAGRGRLEEIEHKP
jgi:hypothetical protein